MRRAAAPWLLAAALAAAGCVSERHPGIADGGAAAGGTSAGSGGRASSEGGPADASAGGDAGNGAGGASAGGGPSRDAGDGGAPSVGADAGDAGPPDTLQSCTTPKDCASGVCAANGKCEPAAVEFTGFVQRHDRVSASFVPGVVVSATNVLPTPKSSPSTTNGQFVLDQVPPESLIDLQMQWDGQDSPVFLPNPLRQTRIYTNTRSVVGAKEFNPPVVEFKWMAQVAVDCGIFPDLATATGGTAINPFWIQRSTLFVEVVDGSGAPVAGVKASDVKLTLDGYSNVDQDPADDHPPAARYCFLDKTGDQVVGTKNTATTSLGRFVVFRVRNAIGTGQGVAEITVKTLPPSRVRFRSSGQIGVVQVGNSTEFTAQPSRPRTFEGDVYPIFVKLGCIGCHSPANPSDPDGGVDQPGYANSVARGPKHLKADYSGTPDQVYEVLMASNGGGCTIDGGLKEGDLERICLNAPKLSLLARKPFAEPPGESDHQVDFFDSEYDPSYVAILEWIEQGANR